MAADGGVRTDGRGTVGRLELGEVGVVAEPRDDFAHVDRLTTVHRHHAEQFIRRKARGCGCGQPAFVPVPREAQQVFAQRTVEVP